MEIDKKKLAVDGQHEPVTWKKRLSDVGYALLAILYVIGLISLLIADNLFSAFIQVSRYFPETRTYVLVIGYVVMSILIFVAVRNQLEKRITQEDLE